MSHEAQNSHWVCHVCNTKGTGESLTCCNCYKVTCAKHLQHVTSLDPDSGLYRLMPICLDCAIREAIH